MQRRIEEGKLHNQIQVPTSSITPNEPKDVFCHLEPSICHPEHSEGSLNNREQTQPPTRNKVTFSNPYFITHLLTISVVFLTRGSKFGDCCNVFSELLFFSRIFCKNQNP